MNDDLRSQIYRSLDQKETDELLEMWKKNDHVEWSDIAFEVLAEILRKRIDDLPTQDNPINEVADKKEETADDGLEHWEAKLLDNENQPDFYDTVEVLDLNKNINRMAKIYGVVFIVLTLSHLGALQGLFMGVFPSLNELLTLIPGILIQIVASGVEITIVYFALKALANLLRILMEMEFTSRGAK